MIKIRYANINDKKFWFSLDKHLSEKEFEIKIQYNTCYIISENNSPVGILRYGLFWDSIPFCNLIYIEPAYQRKGYGKKLLEFWENDMRHNKHDLVMVSTQADESAQFFYRASGYNDCGCLIFNIPEYQQAAEIFMLKTL